MQQGHRPQPTDASNSHSLSPLWPPFSPRFISSVEAPPPPCSFSSSELSLKLIPIAPVYLFDHMAFGGCQRQPDESKADVCTETNKSKCCINDLIGLLIMHCLQLYLYSGDGRRCSCSYFTVTVARSLLKKKIMVDWIWWACTNKWKMPGGFTQIRHNIRF